MTIHRKIDVAAWSDSHRAAMPEGAAKPDEAATRDGGAARDGGANARFVNPTLCGIAGTLVLHSLMLQTALTGSRIRPAHPHEILQPASLNSSNAQPADRLVFLDLPETTKSGNDVRQSPADLRATMRNIPMVEAAPDPAPPPDIQTLAIDETEETVPSTDPGDTAERARLVGIYTGQIQARIERIWRRPRTPINDNASDTHGPDARQSFQCQVQIVQDATGNVQEVLLPNCNGSVAWQRSLVLAIQQASPLPAPPSAKVFARSIALRFVGLPYVSGAAEEEYEMAPVNILQSDAR